MIKFINGLVMTTDNFKNFLTLKEGKKTSTASQYATAIDRLSEHYSKHKGKRIDIYQLNDLNELNRIAELYGFLGKYFEFGDIGHGTYRAAIDALCRFKETPNTEYKSQIIIEPNQEIKIKLIGQLVKDYIKDIFSYCETQNPEELLRLMDKGYSKRVFKLSFPFCKELSLLTEKESKRFYNKDYLVNDKVVRVCSQWAFKSKVMVLDYLLSKKIITEEEFAHYQKVVQKKPQIRNISNNLKSTKDDHEVPIKKKILSDNVILKSRNIDEVFNHFNAKLSRQASLMSEQYKLFYSLERSMRDMISEVMTKEYGNDWWNEKVDSRVRESVIRKIKDEKGTLFTKQSERPIDYALFSELGYIMTYNWGLFSNKFIKDQKVLIRIMTDLNKLRIPIAHCNPFNEKEKNLFYLTVGYWFDILKKTEN